MRRVFIIALLPIFALFGCSSDKDSTTVRIVFPEIQKSSSQRTLAAADGTILPSLWSGSITQFSDIDCFAVLIGGADESFQRNYCDEKETQQRLVNFGDYFGALAPDSGELAIEVDSQKEIQLTILGMSSQDGTCIDFKGFSPPQGFFSHPRILHQQTYIFEARDQELVVEMPAIFDTTVPEIDYCQFDSSNIPPDLDSSANLTFATSGDYNFGTFAVGGVSAALLTLVNSGALAATQLTFASMSLPFRYSGGAYPGLNGTCTDQLLSQESCFLEIEYAPTGLSNSDTLQLLGSYDDGGDQTQQVTRNIAGNAQLPALLTLSDGLTYDFGSIPTGGTGSKTFTVSNTGGVDGTGLAGTGLATPYDFQGGAYPGVGGTCSSTLVGGGSCTMVVDFNPVGLGVANDTIELNYLDGVGPQVVSRDITGTGVAAALLTLSGVDPFDFGTLANGAIVTQIFILTNSGGLPGTSLVESSLAAPYSFNGGSYPGTGGDCGGTLAAGATCNLDISFAPTVSGTHTNAITINYNDGVSAQNTVRNFTGMSTPAALLSISDGPTYDYGIVALGGVSTKTFTINNAGGVTATSMVGSGLASPYTFAGGSYPGSGGTCGATLAGSGSCTVVLDFSPVGIGVANDTLDLNYNDGVSAQIVSRDVTGMGAAPGFLTISESDPFSFGSFTVATSATHTFTITNVGGVTATSLSEIGLASPYSFDGGGFPGTGGNCVTSLAAGASCTIVIDFTPTSMTIFNDTMDITYYDGASVQVASRDVTGTGT